MSDPVCNRPDCHAPNHCDWHDEPVHHAVDSMARWCATSSDGTPGTPKPTSHHAPPTSA